MVLILALTPGAPAAGAGGRRAAHEFSGAGSTRTTVFRLPDRWGLKWSFDCSRSIGGPGVFSIQVVEVDASGARLDLQIPRLLRFDTAGSGFEHYDHGGHRAYLRIASQCPWTVTVAPFTP